MFNTSRVVNFPHQTKDSVGFKDLMFSLNLVSLTLLFLFGGLFAIVLVQNSWQRQPISAYFKSLQKHQWSSGRFYSRYIFQVFFCFFLYSFPFKSSNMLMCARKLTFALITMPILTTLCEVQELATLPNNLRLFFFPSPSTSL